MQKALVVKDLHKIFRLPHERHSSLKQAVLNFGPRSYEKQKVLDGISFEVQKGEFFGILGRNGSGKSTLLKLLAGIYAPTSGSIEVNGRLTPFIELGVGFNPELSGRDNVYLNGAIFGLSRKEVDDLYDEIVEFAELENFMDQKLKNYSSGMQVRLAFSIAIRAHNDILLIDEVLAVGDMKFQQKCYDFFDSIKGKKTVIFVSHDMQAIERFCERTIVIEKGKIVEAGKPDQTIHKYGAIMAGQPFITKSSGKGSHSGSGFAAIEKVEVLNEEGKSTSSIIPGQGFSIRMDYKAKKTIAKPAIHVSVFDDQGVKLVSANTSADNHEIKELSGSGQIELKIASNPLAPGRYTINTGIFESNMMIAHDHFRDAQTFSVSGKKWADYRVNVETSWSHGSKK